MSPRMKGVAVMVAQLVLVMSIGVKYAWERHTCPRVWTRATQVDPADPIRGRYLALQLHASACGLAAGQAEEDYGFNGDGGSERFPVRKWTVVPAARGGKLAPQLRISSGRKKPKN